MCRLLLVLLMISPIQLFAEKGEAKEIPKKDASPEEISKVALSSKNPSVAICAFGIFMESNKDMGSDLTADTVVKFSKRRGLFYKAVGLTSFSTLSHLFQTSLNIKMVTLLHQF